MIVDSLSCEAACELAAVLLGSPVTAAEQVPSFAGNQVFLIRRPGRLGFLKLADGADVKREVAVLALAARHGIPVPVLEAADPEGDRTGRACLLVRKAAGRPARDGSPQFCAAGPALRQLHEIPAPGYGSIVVAQHGLRGEDTSWPDTIRRRISGLQPVADAGLVAAGLLDRAAAAVRGSVADLATPDRGGGRMLHGDFHPRHVYVQRGRVTAIIDWGDATSGDPVYDLARVLHSATLAAGLPRGFAAVDELLQTYGEASWLGAGLRHRLLVYAVVFILWSMQGELAGGSPWPPWWPAQAAALTAILAALD
jgi:aminoglycoside phosphotransferase (APT) family kinase protein